MKDAEDEAFDELAKKQGDWGGGFQAKRRMVADKLQGLVEIEYTLSIAEPAQEPVAHLWECLGKWSAYLVTNGKQADCAPPSWLVEAIQNATAPPKREWVGLTDDALADLWYKESLDWMEFARAHEAALKEKNG